MKAISHVLFIAMLCMPFSPQAAEFVAELGIHAGGDDITTALTLDGDETVTAGGGISFAAGMKLDIGETSSLQLTAGIKEDAINASNGDIEFTRYTLDLLYHIKLNEDISLGVGPTLHTDVELTSSGAGVYYVQDTAFDDALGLLVDGKVQLGSAGRFFLGGRLTIIEYETTQNTLSKKTYSGNSIGLIAGINI